MQELINKAGGLSFTWADVVVVEVLLVCAVVGYWTGFIWQVIRIVSVVAAFWIAAHFHTAVAGWLGGWMNESTRMTISYVGVFLVALLATYVLMFFIRRPINALKPGKPDRALGAVLGTAKGLLLCGIIALGVLRFADEAGGPYRVVDGSTSARVLARCVGVLWIETDER